MKQSWGRPWAARLHGLGEDWSMWRASKSGWQGVRENNGSVEQLRDLRSPSSVGFRLGSATRSASNIWRWIVVLQSRAGFGGDPTTDTRRSLEQTWTQTEPTAWVSRSFTFFSFNKLKEKGFGFGFWGKTLFQWEIMINNKALLNRRVQKTTFYSIFYCHNCITNRS